MVHPIVILLAIVGVLYILFKYLRDKNTKLYDQAEAERKEMFRKALESVKEREDLSEWSEDGFWDMVDKNREGADCNYRYFLVGMKKSFENLKPVDLVQIDNLLIRLYRNAATPELIAATKIIFKNPQDIYLLMNLMFMEGRAFFKAASRDPDLLINKSFTSVDSETLDMIISHIYFHQTHEYIPYYPEDKLKKSEAKPIPDREIPERFPELWNTFA